MRRVFMCNVIVFFMILSVASVVVAQAPPQQQVPQTQQTVIQTTVTEEVIEQVPAPQGPSFGQKMWSGTKTAGRWTWNGIKKVGFYTKEGFVSFLEMTGMKKKQDEGAAHDRILEDANRTLLESRTRRELRDAGQQVQ